MDLDADGDAEIGGVLADLVEGPADLPQGGIEVRPLGDAVGPDLHAGRADVVGQPNVFLGPVDVLPHDRRVGRLVLEGTAQASQLDGRVLESLANVLALGLGQVDLNFVGMGRPQLDALVFRAFRAWPGSWQGPSPWRCCR